jgi:predicted permease
MEKHNKLLQKLSSYVASITLVFMLSSFLFSSTSHAMNPKAKAFLVLTTYGTAGGGLLGLASMAFGEDSIAVARGASLGLYMGMLFGGYVILSHKYKKKPGQIEAPKEDEYQDPYTPYGEDGGEEDEGYDSFFSSPQRSMEYEENKRRDSAIFESSLRQKKGGSSSPPIYMNLINMRF